MDQPGSIDMAEVAEELNRDPLSKALFENAQLRVLARKQAARIEALESQRPAADG